MSAIPIRQPRNEAPTREPSVRPLSGPRRRKTALWIKGLAVLILAGLLVTPIVLRRRTAPPSVEPVYRTEIVTAQPLFGLLKTAGRIEPENRVRIGSLVAGQVTAVKVSVGDRVKRGQVIARIDDREQRASLAGADAQVALAELHATKAEVRLREALRTLKQGGYPLDDPPIEELLEGPAGDAQVDVVDAAVQIQKQDAALALIRHGLARRVIRAPVAGVITSRSIEPGETIASSPPGPPLFVIAPDPQRMRVRTEVDETYVARVEPVQARVTVTALPHRALFAEVQRIIPLLGANRSPMRYGVVLSLDTTDDDDLRAGMSVVVELPMSTPSGALTVPLSAVDLSAATTTGTAPATPIVWLMEHAGQPTPVPVETGVTDGHLIEIRSGRIRAGQTVALVPKAR